MKKLLILFLAAVGAVSGINAQGFVGSWELYSSSPAPTKVIETPEYVYTLSGNSLSAIDKQTGEIQVLNSLNRLNGNKVSKIWYNAKKKCLLVAHTDYNIDLVYDDGRTINVPDLRDAAITGDKTINDADFSGSKAYLALGSGFIVVDIDHGAIVKSHIYNVPIHFMAVTKNHVVIAVTESGASKFKYAPLSSSLNNFSDFTDVVNESGTQLGFMPTAMFGLSDNVIVAPNKVNVLKFDFSAAQPVRSFLRVGSGNIYTEHRTTPTATGYAFSGTDNTVFYANADGSTALLDKNSALNGQLVADWNADRKNFWVADANGTGLYDLDNAAFTSAKIRPQGPTGTNTGRIIPLSDGRVLLSTLEMHQYQSLYNLAYGKTAYADIFNPATRTFTRIDQSHLGSSMRSFNGVRGDENKVIVSLRGKGFNLIDLANNSHIEATIASTPLNDTPTGSAVDSNGNLWLVIIKNASPATVQLLKAPKGSWEATIDGSKWSQIDILGLTPKHSTRMALDEAKGNVIVTGEAIAVVKMPENSQPLTADTQYAIIDVSRDEDDAVTGDPWNFLEPVVDKNGWIWVPHNQGVFVIKDSDRMFEPGYHAMRPKVPRNDGTDLADYLLQQVQCTRIAVDENNQKWIGTLGSGLYRVSPNGDIILEHILSSSSQMPSDDIYDVAPSKINNDVFVGTGEGFAIYHSESSPAADNYDNVYAYPNPVTPDYNGYITIVGLMDDSLVKIADASGTIVHEGRSNGGMCVWNGCDATGRRVRSGVYFVFASQTAEDQSNAAVTKIIVVN